MRDIDWREGVHDVSFAHCTMLRSKYCRRRYDAVMDSDDDNDGNGDGKV